MLNLIELEQFVAFAYYGTLSKASIPLLLNPVPLHPCGPYSLSYPPIILTCPFHPVSRILTIS